MARFKSARDAPSFVGRQVGRRELTRRVSLGIQLVNQPRVAGNFDTILLNRPNDLHGIITA